MGKVWDAYGKHVDYYKDVPKILQDLSKQGFKLGIASRFQQQSGLPFNQMLFFDDEYRNIRDVGSLGVTCIHAENGVSRSVIEEGLRTFALKNS